MEARQQQLELISKRIEQANDKINKSIKYLHWNKEDLKKWNLRQKKLVQCPLRKHHVVPGKSFEEHYRRCVLKSNSRYPTIIHRNTC